MYKLSPLPFAYDALEPYIDEETMKVHYGKHHQAYTDKLNAALELFPQFYSDDLRGLIWNPEQMPEEIRQTVINNGGGYLNHSFFWKIIAPPESQENKPGTLLSVGEEIIKQFGSYDEFKKLFKDKAVGLFGSGWTWLVKRGSQLEIINTANQNLLPREVQPILTIDLWEHAYYLKYQNRRSEYIDSFFHVINWAKVEELFKQ